MGVYVHYNKDIQKKWDKYHYKNVRTSWFVDNRMLLAGLDLWSFCLVIIILPTNNTYTYIYMFSHTNS